MINVHNMKRSIKIATPVFIIMAIVSILNGCKKEDPPSAQETVTAQLTSAAAWQSPVVTVDGINYSDVYKDFSITFGQNTYTTQSGNPIWLPSGTWAFTNEEATLLKFDGTMDVEINSITTDFLELTVQWDKNTFDPGRVNSVKGKHQFKLKKK